MKKVIEIIKQVELVKGKEKEKVLRANKENELLRKILFYTYDGNLKFKMSKKTIKPRDGESKWKDLFSMLDELNASNINDNLRINVNKFLGSIEEDDERDLVTKILLKDLKIGISVKTINKAMDGLIFDFQVMKASAWNDKTKEGFIKKAKKQGYMMMIKDNGERGEVIKENGKVTIKSRQNKVFEGLVDLEKAFELFMPDNTFYEGELLAFEPNGREWETSEDQFKLTNKILHTDGEKHGIYINLFDMVPLEDFKKGIYEEEAKNRKHDLKIFVDNYALSNMTNNNWNMTNNNSNLIQFAEILYQGTNTDLIQPKLEEVSEGSWKEGLMVLLNDSIYETKRVNYHLKVKLWQNMDLKVIGLKESLEKPNTLGSLILDYKGEEQGASGISDKLKELWWNNPKEILGKVVEVKYKAVTKDKDGKESLQFCNFVRVREEGKEVSYE